MGKNKLKAKKKRLKGRKVANWIKQREKVEGKRKLKAAIQWLKDHSPEPLT